MSLTVVEIEEAMEFGRSMYRHSQDRGLTDYIASKIKGERAQMIGALAERAGSKILDLPWTRWVDTFHSPDLHHNIEVRLIGVDSYGLRVYEKDHDSRRVVGVVIEKGKENEPYRVPGWINAKYAKQEEYLMDPNGKGHPFFGVPQCRLQPISVLRELIDNDD